VSEKTDLNSFVNFVKYLDRDCFGKREYLCGNERTKYQMCPVVKKARHPKGW